LYLDFQMVQCLESQATGDFQEVRVPRISRTNSINDNLGLFRRQSLVATVIGWFKAFPSKKLPRTSRPL